MQVDESTLLAMPQEAAFRLLTRWETFLDRVDEDVVSITRTPEGPVGPGTVFAETLRAPVGKLAMRATVTTVDAPHRMDFDLAGPGVGGHGFLSFTSEGDATRFRVFIEAKPHGAGWLLLPMLRMDLPRRERKRLARLREMVAAGELAAPNATGG